MAINCGTCQARIEVGCAVLELEQARPGFSLFRSGKENFCWYNRRVGRSG